MEKLSIPRPAILAGRSLLAALSMASIYGAEGAEPALKQAEIKGLLVVQLADGSVAGAASQMNATVVKGSEGEFSLGFNQDVGDQMEKATVEVQKFISVRHGDKVPNGYRVELAFADKYSPKDGPSAAVVCALMTDSIITGDEIDPGFAATGDMTATGQVRPVGGITGKIRGAIKKKCSIIGIPKPNDKSISDLYLIEGIKPLYQIQTFSLETFDQAKALAGKNRTGDLQKAIDEFTEVQKVLQKNEKYIRNQAVRTKLRAIVKLAPNHMSARLLFLHGERKGPKKLSLLGSIEAIDKAAQSFSIMLETGSFLETNGSDDVLFSLISELKRQRPKLDQRTIAYSDSHTELAEFFKALRGKKYLNKQMERELNSGIRKLNSERTKVLNNPEVQEELMLE